MKPLYVMFLTAMLVLNVGGCTQPPAQRQTAVDAEFTLRTPLSGGRMVFVGVGENIDGDINPELVAQPGHTVHVVVINGDGLTHDLAIPDLKVGTSLMSGKDQMRDVTFEVHEAGAYAYYCTVSGHRQAGMEGQLVVVGP